MVFPDYCSWVKPIIDSWAEAQWQAHCAHVTDLHHADIAKIMKAGKWLVLTTEDHAATKLVGFCAWWHEELTLQTFTPGPVWKEEKVPPAELAQLLIEMIPKGSL